MKGDSLGRKSEVDDDQTTPVAKRRHASEHLPWLRHSKPVNHTVSWDLRPRLMPVVASPLKMNVVSTLNRRFATQ